MKIVHDFNILFNLILIYSCIDSYESWNSDSGAVLFVMLEFKMSIPLYCIFR